MNLGLPGKRSSQFELHTQQIVIHLVLNRAWSFGFMCVGSIVLGQFTYASSIFPPSPGSNRLIEPAPAGSFSTTAFMVRVTCRFDLASV
jgi:hypothetical protein